MRTRVLLLAFAAVVIAVPARAEDPVLFWSHAYGSQNPDGPFGLAIDGADNIYMIGLCGQNVDFGCGPLYSDGSDMFLVKFDRYGFCQWGRTFHAVGNAVAIDGDGNVVVAGYANNGADLGGGPLTGNGISNLMLAKFTPGGVYVWGKLYGGPGSSTLGWAVAVDPSGNLLVSGPYSGTTNLGGGPLTSAGEYDAFVASYYPDGSHHWSRRAGSTYIDYATGVAADGTGRVAVTGFCYGNVDFGGGTISGGGGWDVFLAQYSSDGSPLWSQVFGDAADQDGASVAVDAANNIYTSGTYASTVDFGGGLLMTTGRDMFLVKHDASGAHQWSRSLGGSYAGDRAGPLAVDASGAVSMTGGFGGLMNLDGHLLVGTGGTKDIFVAQFDPAGTCVWARGFGGITSSDQGETVALDSQGGIVVGASFQGTMSLDSKQYTSAGWEDIFLARFVRLSATAVTNPPLATSIGPNYPNPFNPTTTIEYTLSTHARVTIEILDVTGSVVARLEQGARPAGSYRATWNGCDAYGRTLASGVYFYRLAGRNSSAAGKMVLLR